MQKADVVIVGLGYVGLPTAAIIASKGMRVHGVDINPDVIATINRGDIHVVEPDLEGLVRYNVERKLLRAHKGAVPADTFIIAVPTPFKKNKRPDISHVESAIDIIAPYLQRGNLIIIESTCPVGTTELMLQRIEAERPDLAHAIHMAYCPERILPGEILQEIVHNDRSIGGIDKVSTEKAIDFYAQFVQGKLYGTSARTAEMCKLVENAYRDTNIAFANELSLICEDEDIDVWELIDLANKHPRVNILQPGPGVGGHCIAVDPWFIVDSAPTKARMIRTAREINDRKPFAIAGQIRAAAKKIKNPVIACLGLAYKADIDDMRESPSVAIVKELAAKKAGKLLVVEPYAKSLPRDLAGMQSVKFVGLDQALQQADIVAILVGHRQFKKIDRSAFAARTVIDACGLLRIA
jgi:UDP-N-acetyl-D-mannosaminuronic acid dehydrogenase